MGAGTDKLEAARTVRGGPQERSRTSSHDRRAQSVCYELHSTIGFIYKVTIVKPPRISDNKTSPKIHPV